MKIHKINQQINCTINLVSGNSTGLSNDALILKQALIRGGWGGELRHFSGTNSKLVNIWLLLQLFFDKYILHTRQYTLHLEELYHELIPFSEHNILIPNQEWLRSGTQQLITKKIKLWCKTQYACQQLDSLSKQITFLGFSSPDRLNSNIQRKNNHFIHVAGKSAQKGTIPLLTVWQQHPEWPTLRVISRNPAHQGYRQPNIELISDFLTEEQLSLLMNESVFHLCPSESEGFGHTIVEALSIGAIVITTNGPPMNELVDSECGFLVNWKSKKKQYFSEMYSIDEQDLERIISKVLVLTEQKIKAMRIKSRQKYQHKTKQFYRQLISNFQIQITNDKKNA